MKRREWIGSLTALAFSGLSAYANKKAESLPKILLQEEEKQTESWTQGNIRFTWLQDNNGEKRMPNSLFSGADAETIQRLSPEGGALATSVASWCNPMARISCLIQATVKQTAVCYPIWHLYKSNLKISIICF